MWTCKQVAKSLEKQRLSKFPLVRRIGTKLHIKLCVVCGKYHNDMVMMQECVDCLLENEETAGTGARNEKLSTTAKEELKEAIRQTQGS